jgi:geranyl-CoA carboxylase alpha subunit
VCSSDLAKIISWGKDRDSARINLQKTIDETIIFGVPTNKLFLSEVLKNNIFTKGKATTSFIAEEIRGFNYSINQPQPVYCLLAAVIQYIIDCENIWSKSIIVSEELVNWSSGNSLMSRFSFMVGTDDFSVSVSPKSNSAYDARIKDFSKIIEVVKKEAHMIVLIADNKKYEINYFLSENRLLFINLDGNNLEFLNKSSSSGFNINNDSNGILSSPMHGKLLDILVKKGSKVVKGMPLVIIEAMKMQHQIEAESEGVVNEIFVNPGKQVVSDQKILEIHLDKQKKKL